MNKPIKLNKDQANKIIKKLLNYNPKHELNERLYEIFRRDLKKPRLIVLQGGKK